MTVPFNNSFNGTSDSDEPAAGTPRSGLREAIEQATAMASSLEEALARSTAELEASRDTTQTNQEITLQFERARAQLMKQLDVEHAAATARAERSLDDARDQIFSMNLAVAALEQARVEAECALAGEDEDGLEDAAPALREQLADKILQARSWCRAKGKVWPATESDYSVLCSIRLAGDDAVNVPGRARRGAAPGWFIVLPEAGCWARAGVELKSGEVDHLPKGLVFRASERRMTNPAPTPGLARLKMSHGCEGWTSEVGSTSGQPICVPFEGDRCEALYEVMYISFGCMFEVVVM